MKYDPADDVTQPLGFDLISLKEREMIDAVFFSFLILTMLKNPLFCCP
jgi:hypothetical protein